MRFTRLGFVLLLMALVVALLAGGAHSDPVVVSTFGPATTYGWQLGACYNGKAIFSSYNPGAVANPGPVPFYNIGFQCGETGSTGQPGGQGFVGTDRYTGTKLADIKKIDYWAILDWRGPNTFSLMDENGCAVYHEWRLQSVSSQPPAVVLYFTVQGTPTGDFRTAIYRPWNDNPVGFGPSFVEFSAAGNLRRHRMWEQYTAVDVENGIYEGVWYVTESADIDHPTGMYTWEELLAKYPEAALETPSVSSTPIFYQDPAQSPIGASFNIHMGAMASTNGDWASVGKDAWWYEAYMGAGATDLVTFAYDADPAPEVESIVAESFDFEAADLINPELPRGCLERAMNNAALTASRIYMPGLYPDDPAQVYYYNGSAWVWGDNRRTRKSVKPTEPIEWGEGAVANAGMYPWSAIARQGTYGYSVVDGVRKGNLQVFYGRICTDPPVVTGRGDGRWFYVDDGAGVKVKCYCPGAVYDGRIAEGNYVRMVGTLQGNNANEWYWNNFHYINPSQTITSQPWPWEFMTYLDNVTVLDP